MIRCPECDVVYEVVYNVNPVYYRIEFCPFCGAEYTEAELTRIVAAAVEEGIHDL